MEYKLGARVDYVRRPVASTLFFSLARKAQRAEEEGSTVEFFQGHITSEGDYVAIVGWDDT